MTVILLYLGRLFKNPTFDVFWFITVVCPALFSVLTKEPKTQGKGIVNSNKVKVLKSVINFFGPFNI